MCPCSSARKARKAPNTFHTPLSQSFWHLCDSLILLPAAGLCGAPVIPSQVSCAPARCTMGVIPPASENNFFLFWCPELPPPPGWHFWLLMAHFAQLCPIFCHFCPFLSTFGHFLLHFNCDWPLFNHYWALLPKFIAFVLPCRPLPTSTSKQQKWS